MARCIHRLLSESNKNQETVETVDNLTKQHLLGSLRPTFFVSFNYEKRAASLRNIRRNVQKPLFYKLM